MLVRISALGAKITWLDLGACGEEYLLLCLRKQRALGWLCHTKIYSRVQIIPPYTRLSTTHQLLAICDPIIWEPGVMEGNYCRTQCIYKTNWLGVDVENLNILMWARVPFWIWMIHYHGWTMHNYIQHLDSCNFSWSFSSSRFQSCKQWILASLKVEGKWSLDTFMYWFCLSTH